MMLRDTAPAGGLAGRWQRRRNELELVGPTRRRQHQVIVVGAGLAGASAAATLGELGYNVRCLTFHDSPRRAHSVAAQGGINAARDAANDGDSVERLFHDTLEGGDFRSRESNVYRLAELSARIIDQAVAQGVPFAREYGGHLATRSFGGALVSRTFYARGQTGQQLLLGAYQALAKEVAANSGFVQFHPTCLPAAGEHQAKLTLMSESLRNDARLWVPRQPGDDRQPEAVPEAERDYFLERRYPRYGNLVPRDLGSRAAKTVCDEGQGVGPGGRAVYLDLGDAAARVGAGVLRERYGNLFELYRHITGDDPLEVPMRVAPAAHYTMGGLWVDYDLMSTIPGLFVIGEANFSDQPGGARRTTSIACSAACCGTPAGWSAAATGWQRRSKRSRRCARRSGRT